MASLTDRRLDLGPELDPEQQQLEKPWRLRLRLRRSSNRRPDLGVVGTDDKSARQQNEQRERRGAEPQA